MRRRDHFPKRIVVLGAGGWVRDRCAPALRPYREDGVCEMVILHDSAYPDRRGQLAADGRDPFKKAIAEKPFDVDRQRIHDLRDEIERSSSTVRGFDRYSVCANKFVKEKDRLGIDDHLERALNSFTFSHVGSRRHQVGRTLSFATLVGKMLESRGLDSLALLTREGAESIISRKGRLPSHAVAPLQWME